jgi:hypothetical protein
MVKLELMAQGLQKEKRITGPGEHPPCFTGNAQYEAWREAAFRMDGAPPPVRKDWPKEPNYCRDCSPEGRNKMRKAGKCLFPSTVFIEVGAGEDREVVGTSK